MWHFFVLFPLPLVVTFFFSFWTLIFMFNLARTVKYIRKKASSEAYFCSHTRLFTFKGTKTLFQTVNLICVTLCLLLEFYVLFESNWMQRIKCEYEKRSKRGENQEVNITTYFMNCDPLNSFVFIVCKHLKIE